MIQRKQSWCFVLLFHWLIYRCQPHLASWSETVTEFLFIVWKEKLSWSNVSWLDFREIFVSRFLFFFFKESDGRFSTLKMNDGCGESETNQFKQVEKSRNINEQFINTLPLYPDFNCVLIFSQYFNIITTLFHKMFSQYKYVKYLLFTIIDSLADGFVMYRDFNTRPRFRSTEENKVSVDRNETTRHLLLTFYEIWRCVSVLYHRELNICWVSVGHNRERLMDIVHDCWCFYIVYIFSGLFSGSSCVDILWLSVSFVTSLMKTACGGRCSDH